MIPSLGGGIEIPISFPFRSHFDLKENLNLYSFYQRLATDPEFRPGVTKQERKTNNIFSVSFYSCLPSGLELVIRDRYRMRIKTDALLYHGLEQCIVLAYEYLF
ncbi:MAG TPA: hypothetical protein VKY57_04365 [Chitinispirillaceae bacterium]|nr:hypothetical protein [Chitinispirillaceae bacterium]